MQTACKLAFQAFYQMVFTQLFGSTSDGKDGGKKQRGLKRLTNPVSFKHNARVLIKKVI